MQMLTWPMYALTLTFIVQIRSKFIPKFMLLTKFIIQKSNSQAVFQHKTKTQRNMCWTLLCATNTNNVNKT